MTSLEAPLLLKSRLTDVSTIQLERYVLVAGNDVRRRAKCFIMTDELDPELACKVYEEFVDVATDNRLHLSTGPLKYEFFRQCLGGQARAHWDTIVHAQRGGQTLPNFNAAITSWFSKYFEATAIHDQKQYLLKAVKAFGMTVKETATQVNIIVRYMAYMPGAVANVPALTELDIKMTV